MISANEPAAPQVTVPMPTIPRVLVVEDEALIGMLIAEFLERADFEVIGPATSVERALKLIEQKGCDIAVLDIRLGESSAEPIACELRARGTPFITLSGYAPAQRAAVFEGAPMLVKPVRPADLIAELRRCLVG